MRARTTSELLAQAARRVHDSKRRGLPPGGVFLVTSEEATRLEKDLCGYTNDAGLPNTLNGLTLRVIPD